MLVNLRRHLGVTENIPQSYYSVANTSKSFMEERYTAQTASLLLRLSQSKSHWDHISIATNRTEFINIALGLH